MDTISIKEYAKRVGISPQAVYKKIKSPQFQPYIQRDSGGNIVLDVAVLADKAISKNAVKYSAKQSTVEQQLNQPLTTVESTVNTGKTGNAISVDSTVEQPNHSTVDKPLKTAVESPHSDVSQQTLNYMAEEIKRLETALRGKEEALKDKEEEIRLLNARIADYADKFANLTHEAHQLAAIAHNQKQITAPAEEQKPRSWLYRFLHSTTPGK